MSNYERWSDIQDREVLFEKPKETDRLLIKVRRDINRLSLGVFCVSDLDAICRIMDITDKEVREEDLKKIEKLVRELKSR